MNTTDLKQLDDLLKKRFREELRNYPTKDDLKAFATKDDLKTALASYPTKDDLKKALSNHPTKKDMKDSLDELLVDIVEAVDKAKAERSEVEELKRRIGNN